MNPSNNIDSSSTPQAGADLDNDFLSQVEMITDGSEVSSFATNTIPPVTSIENEKLQIIAEPNGFYRARYPCEIRNNRFIQAEENSRRLEYPTIKVFIFYLKK